MNRLAAIAIVVLTGVLTGCERSPEFSAVTNAPPGATAELHTNRSNDTHAILLTEGVALAVECVDGKGRPCSFDGTRIDDDATASFRRAYADIENKDVYSRGYQQKSSLNRTVFVVTAKKPGTTTLTVRTGDGDVPVTIEVLPSN